MRHLTWKYETLKMKCFLKNIVVGRLFVFKCVFPLHRCFNAKRGMEISMNGMKKVGSRFYSLLSRHSIGGTEKTGKTPDVTASLCDSNQVPPEYKSKIITKHRNNILITFFIIF
jgi:hypothetical protein